MAEARELMVDPDFIEHDAPVEEVAEEFLGAENTLIVREEKEIVGEIHENSLLKMLIPEERLDEEEVIGILGFSFDEAYVPEKAEHLMNEHDVTVPPDETVGEIAFILHREDLRSVPVEEDGEVIGVVHEDRLMEEI